MMRSLWISKTGMEAQATQLDTISHNLANVSTNGFKRSHAVFEDLMYQNLRQAGANSTEQTTLPTGLQVGLGTRAVATSRNFSQGNLQQSSNPLDVAVRGNGFFEIQMPDGTTGYTRDGSFQVSAQGQLVTNNGYVVQPGITIPANAQSVTIGNDGTVSVALPGQALPSSVGQLQIASFVNPAGLDPKGQNLFAETAASGTANSGAPGQNGLGQIQQGFVVRLYHDQSLYKEPGGGITPAHADQYYWPLASDRTITAWIPLQAVPDSMGPLGFYARSQRVQFGRDLGISDESEAKISENMARHGLRFEVGAFDLGEISFHLGWTFHKAGPNVSKEPRSVMTIIYMDADMQLAESISPAQANDRDHWCPGALPGQVIDTRKNPVVYRG